MMTLDMAKQTQNAEEPAEPSPQGFEALTDNDCAILARSGNEFAQCELVHRYTPGVYNLFVRTLGSRETAADATQEVFLRVFRRLHDFDARRDFQSWLFAIAWNFARDQLRRRATRKKGIQGLYTSSFPASSDGDDEVFEPADRSSPTPFEALERKERSELVHDALSHLEPRQQAMLVLREFEGLSYEELSEVFGCRIGTVKSGIHRARLELKNKLMSLFPFTFEE